MNRKLNFAYLYGFLDQEHIGLVIFDNKYIVANAGGNFIRGEA